MQNAPLDRIELAQQLRSLIEEAQHYSSGDLHRQKALTKAIRILSTLLWKERSPYYNDALQQTFEYFCRHVDDYDPERGSVVTWLNNHLHWRLVTFSRPAKEIPFSQFITHDGDRLPFIDIPDAVDRTSASILEIVHEWAENDPTGELRNARMRKYPQVTAQLLILRRLPPETSWKTLSETLEIGIPTLAAFYQRQCLPRLREFGKTQGYLSDD